MEEGDRVTKRELADVQLILSAARRLVQRGSQIRGNTSETCTELQRKFSLTANLMQSLLQITMEKYAFLYYGKLLAYIVKLKLSQKS